MSKALFIFLSLLASFSVHAAEKTKLDRLLSADMLSAQRAYFESIAGVAKYVQGKTRKYDVDGCMVGIKENKDYEIISIELENISSACTFDTAKIYLQGPAHRLTFGALSAMGIASTARESCFESCGNAADPTYGLGVEMPRARGSIEVDAGVDYNDESGKAADRLHSRLKNRYPRAELFGDFLGKSIPKTDYSTIWLVEFRSVRITSIKFGYGIVAPR